MKCIVIRVCVCLFFVVPMKKKVSLDLYKILFSFFPGKRYMYRNYLVERVYVRRIRTWLTAKTILGIFKLQNIIDFILLIMTVRARLLASGLLFLHSWHIRKYIHTQKKGTNTPAASWSIAWTKDKALKELCFFFSHLSQRFWPAANTNSWCNDIPKKSINFDDS